MERSFLSARRGTLTGKEGKGTFRLRKGARQGSRYNPLLPQSNGHAEREGGGEREKKKEEEEQVLVAEESPSFPPPLPDPPPRLSSSLFFFFFFASLSCSRLFRFLCLT